MVLRARTTRVHMIQPRNRRVRSGPGSGSAFLGPKTATIRKASAMISVATKGMSVWACLAIMKYWGEVAVTTAPRSPMRRDQMRDIDQ